MEKGGADLGVDEAQVRQWLVESSERLVDMMDALVSHAKQGREAFEKGVDLNEVIHGIKGDFRCMMKRTAGSVECTTPMPRMSTDQAANAFQAFKRFASESEGMGMVMCHVRQIIEAHGGSIWVESVLGEGTTMAFTLPQTQLV